MFSYAPGIATMQFLFIVDRGRNTWEGVESLEEPDNGRQRRMLAQHPPDYLGSLNLSPINNEDCRKERLSCREFTRKEKAPIALLSETQPG
jgi:hypothetical protein